VKSYMACFWSGFLVKGFMVYMGLSVFSIIIKIMFDYLNIYNDEYMDLKRYKSK